MPKEQDPLHSSQPSKLSNECGICLILLLALLGVLILAGYAAWG